MSRMLSYSAKTVRRVGIIDGHWVLVKTSGEKVIADGCKFIVRLNDYNIPIFLNEPEGGRAYWSLSHSNEDEHRSRLEEYWGDEDSWHMVNNLNNYINQYYDDYIR